MTLRHLACLLLVAAPWPAAASLAVPASTPGSETSRPVATYRPTLKVPESLEPYLRHVAPGLDSFPEEKEAADLSARLAELGRRLRANPAGAAEAAEFLLAPDFKGGHLTASAESTVAQQPALQILRAKTLATDLLDRRAFGAELGKLVEGLRAIQVAEFLITAIDLKHDEGLARTDVRYDIVGTSASAWRAERVGHWHLQWKRDVDGTWRVLKWSASEPIRSSAATPIFTEVTAQAVGADAAFRNQLTPPLDAWLATIDSVLTRDSIGHHGVSVGDADGDGLDDLYVAQPSGLPNRLLRAKGDGTFQDVTEQAGLGVLDDTSQSLFVDVDNDGDQDLILATGAGPLLFVNDGKGKFAKVSDAFRLKDGLRGSLTSIAVADYDRDGFLDLYLCTYLYFMGASQDKAGPPTPYHDAQNGPPNVLLRNDGHGHFVDVTAATGLDQNNDRFSLAAAWSDYDGDGWPDLLVSNDFGRKNLYHNLGLRDGRVRFEDVAAAAGIEDYGAGMSAAWLDYDNDGRMDVYTGNMWSAAGQRVTAQAHFMPDAAPDVRAIYRRHARGNALFRNLGDGRFEDVTLSAGVALGRWAWSSDALDFDSDGWEDLYVANGMITRPGDDVDLEGFFWRQLIPRSPLTRITGTPYDDVWRVINRFVADRSWASHQRNVFLRNDGHGAFDDVSGTVGLDLEQDGRSFAVLDYDADGDPDLVTMAARSAPQLRVFRNDFAARGSVLALRLVGTRCNRDAIGARVTVETDVLRRTKMVQAGSGFISQHSKELLFGLGASRRIVKIEIQWPSGGTQTFADIPVDRRMRVEEGSDPIVEPLRAPRPYPTQASPLPPAQPSNTSWLYEPFPAPDFTLQDLHGQPRSLSTLRGHPTLMLFWTTDAPAARAALLALEHSAPALARAGVGVLAIALDAPADLPKVRAAAATLAAVPVLPASAEMATSYAILNRHLFVDRQDLRLPTTFLLNARAEIVKVYRDRLDVAQVLADVPAIEASEPERLARAVPFPGTFHAAMGERDYLPYGRELLEQGAETAAVSAFERAVRGHPTPFTLYSLGTLLVKSRQPAKARAAFERALALQPELSEANNDLGALLAQSGDVPAAIERFRAALATTPEYPDALNNLGYALLLTGREQEAYDLYRKTLELQPDFPEALNNLGLILARRGDLEHAETYFRQALTQRPSYSEAGNNLALVLVGRSQAEAAVQLLRELLERDPGFETTYITLAKIYLSTDRGREGVQVLEQLLQRNPKHELGLELLRQFKPR
jgi:Flp pilus assembly protein TadD/peroxiredoxin